MECEVEGVPPTKDMVKWLRNGDELRVSKRGDQKAILRLNASTDSAGQYMCQGYNGIGDPSVVRLCSLVLKSTLREGL